MATVVLTPDAAQELEELSNPIHGRVLKLLARMENWPDVSGAKPFAAIWPDVIACGLAIIEFNSRWPATW